MNWGMTLFIIILSYAVSIGTRLMIKLTFLKYDDIATAKKISGAEAARAVLDGRGLSYVSVERIRSDLSDSSTLMRVELSESTFDSDSVAAVGMAAYQAGHVMQRADGYSLNSLTGVAGNVSAICSQFLVVVLFLGSLFSIEPLIRLGTVLFIVMAVFQGQGYCCYRRRGYGSQGRIVSFCHMPKGVSYPSQGQFQRQCG